MRPLFQCKLQYTHSQLTNEHKLHPQPCVYNYLLSNSLRSAKGSAKKTESSCSKAMTGGVYDSVSTAFFFSLLCQTLKIRSEINVGTSLKHAKEDCLFLTLSSGSFSLSTSTSSSSSSLTSSATDKVQVQRSATTPRYTTNLLSRMTKKDSRQITISRLCLKF